jgi:adenine-specific DNA-methyltransferase
LAEADRLIRAGRLDAVLAENDRLVLREAIGLSAAECSCLREAWQRMRNRRTGRRRRSGLDS